jgi:hypothetical protein
LAKYRTIYLARQEVAASEMKTIADFNSDPDSDCCSRDHTGIFNHNNVKCPVNSSPGLASTVCPFEEWYTCKDRLRWITSAIQPAPISSRYSTPSPITALSMTTGVFCLPDHEILGFEVILISTETLDCRKTSFDHRIGI